MKNIRNLIETRSAPFSLFKRLCAILWMLLLLGFFYLSSQLNEPYVTTLTFTQENAFQNPQDARALYFRVSEQLLKRYAIDIDESKLFFQIREKQYIIFIRHNDLKISQSMTTQLTSLFKDEVLAFYQVRNDNLQKSLRAFNVGKSTLNKISETYALVDIKLDFNQETRNKIRYLDETIRVYTNRQKRLQSVTDTIQDWDNSIFQVKTDSIQHSTLLYLLGLLVLGFILIFSDELGVRINWGDVRE